MTVEAAPGELLAGDHLLLQVSPGAAPHNHSQECQDDEGDEDSFLHPSSANTFILPSRGVLS